MTTSIQNSSRLEMLRGSHDLRLPAWGPYGKRYIGVSHIPDLQSAMRFDLSVFPGLYRRSVQVPNVLWESGYHPWEAAPDFSYYSHRHQLLWRDQLYYDIAYCRLDDGAVLIHATAVNQSDAPQQLSLQYAAWLNFPPLQPYSTEVLQPDSITLPPGAIWVNAMDYDELTLARPDPRANLTVDGKRRCEIRAQGFIDGTGLGDGWGESHGDRVHYRFRLSKPMVNAMLILRAGWAKGVYGRIRLDCVRRATNHENGHGELRYHYFYLGTLSPGEYEATFTATGTTGEMPEIQMNGFLVIDERDRDKVEIEPAPWNPIPTRLAAPRKENTLLLQYQHVEPVYGLAWGTQPSVVREIHGETLDNILRYKVHEHVAAVFDGEGKGHFTNVLMQPIFLAPGERHTSVGLVCAGTKAEVSKRLKAFDPSPAAWEETINTARQRAIRFHANPSGDIYRLSQERMAATLATNVVYPIRTRGRWIRHYTPGRWWDSLYTWDSGFIGLGLLELDAERAIDVLNAYLTEPGDGEAAFIHHGSMVPTQFYLFAELWNRTQDRQLLAYFYPRLQQYHRFLAGRLGSSTTRNLQSGLLRPWDYWYNSGGWDDYPPQLYARNNAMYGYVTPVITTAHTIRTAKILRMAAQELGEDSTEYERDIAILSDALQRYAWDEECGYFSYVLHDDEGKPTTFMRHNSGANFNMGLDGATPLVADCCTPDQSRQLIAHLMTPGELWTPIGLSTVDQRAPYYRDDGYWNGAVWMAHQFLFWKALLDQGEGDAAYHIAETALALWQQEVERTYNCVEHFVISSGRGAGWHHFGGLSSPVLNWYSAYHRPGRLSMGHNGWVHSLDIGDEQRSLTAEIGLHGNAEQRPLVIATLAAAHRYVATWNGEPIPVHTRLPGTTEITLPTGSGRGRLVVQTQDAPG